MAVSQVVGGGWNQEGNDDKTNGVTVAMKLMMDETNFAPFSPPQN